MNIYTWYENCKGGVNNLCIVQDCNTGLTATSTKGKQCAVVNLKRKIRRVLNGIR